MRFLAAAMVGVLCLLPGVSGAADPPAQRVAYVVVPTVDSGSDGFCFVYTRGEPRSVVNARLNPAMSPGFPKTKPYYAFLDYTVAPDEGSASFSSFFTATNPRPAPFGPVTVPLFERPQPGWPCTAQVWAALGFRPAADEARQTGPSPAAAPLYYAYVEINDVDTKMQPIRNKAGLQVTTRFCLLWQPGWDLDNRNLTSLGDGFYRSFSYRIAPDRKRLTLYQLAAPAVLADANGGAPKPVGGTRTYRADITVPLYSEPQPGWPCTRDNWAADLASVRARQAAGGGGGGPVVRPGPIHPVRPQGPGMRGLCNAPLNRPMGCM